MKYTPHILWIVCIAVLTCMGGCNSSLPVQSGSYKMLYDYQASGMHPEFVLYHTSNDSTRIYYRIRSSELLYSRTASDAPFLAKFKLGCEVFGEAGAMTDSSSIIVTDAARNAPGWLLGHFDIRLPQGLHNLVIECTDLKKNISFTSYIRAEKTSTFSAQNYLLLNAHTQEPFFGSFAGTDAVVNILSARNISHPLRVTHYSDEIKLPPPPFSNSSPEMPNLTKAQPENIESDSSGSYFLVENGIYFISTDPENKTGALVVAASDYYPEIKALDQLHTPLRYITTKVEYEDINTHYFPKKKVDDFWIECAGGKDRARDLIRIYYNRVQEANYYFSSYTEGWRTDRGMIHIVFGNPTRIVKQSTYETWIYGEEGQAGTLTFVFKKVESPVSSNIFVLNRDPAFKQHWEKQVTTWRNGRVYNE